MHWYLLTHWHLLRALCDADSPLPIRSHLFEALIDADVLADSDALVDALSIDADVLAVLMLSLTHS